MPGFTRRQGQNSIAVFVPTGKRYPSGQPVRYYETVRRAPGETDKELEARADARKAELELEFYRGDRLAAPKRYTVGQLLADWLAGPVAEKLATGDLQEATGDKYKMNVQVHLIPRFGTALAAGLAEADIESVYRQMTAAGASPATVAGAHRTLHTALNWAVRKHLIRVNPAALVENKPADPKTEPPTLSFGSALKLIETARCSPHEAAIVAALLAGTRIGEMLGLPRANVDWPAGVIHIRQALKKTGPVPKFGPPKTPKSIRDIPLEPLLADFIRETIALADANAEKRRAKGKPYHDYGLVFANLDGRPINRHNLGRRAFRALLNRAGLPRMRPHDLRHTFTTLAKELGIDSKAVADALGQADSTLVDRLYGHRSLAAQQSLFSRLYKRLQKRTE